MSKVIKLGEDKKVEKVKKDNVLKVLEELLEECKDYENHLQRQIRVMDGIEEPNEEDDMDYFNESNTYSYYEGLSEGIVTAVVHIEYKIKEYNDKNAV